MSRVMRVRLADQTTDIEGIAQVVNSFEQTPVEHEMVRQWFAYAPTGRIVHRIVATVGDDRVAGYGVAVHEAWQPDGEFYAWVGVLPGHRGQGLGRRLADNVADFLSGQHVSRLKSEVRDDDDVSQKFAQRAGFRHSLHLYASAIDVERFDETPFLGVLSDLEQQGIRFCSVADFGDDAPTRARLHALNTITSRDIPGAEGPEIPFDDFEKWVCGSTWYRPEGQLLAVDGDTWVGLCSIQLLPAAQKAYNVMTGVLPAYRGRKIALALKVLAIRYARRAGARTLDTNNASDNAPMLAVNRKLGYVPSPGKYLLVREGQVAPL